MSALAVAASSDAPGLQPGEGGSQPTLPLHLFDATWRLASRVEHATRDDLDWMVRRHYLGRWPGVTVCRLGLSIRWQLRGMVIFALPPRETSVRYGGPTWELARLWIEDGVPRNAESWLLAQSVRHVRRVHDIAVLVSYADPSHGHAGTIYRAAGWIPDGRTDQGRVTPRVDYRVGGKTYSRRGHVPDGVQAERIPRVSKWRYYLRVSR